jgi:hypothetical protein
MKSRLEGSDEQARGLRLLLLGKGAVFAHRFERSLAAEMDETQSCTPAPSSRPLVRRSDRAGRTRASSALHPDRALALGRRLPERVQPRNVSYAVRQLGQAARCSFACSACQEPRRAVDDVAGRYREQLHAVGSDVLELSRLIERAG